MRILLTTRGSAGHLLPLAPIGHACIAAGHELRVAAQRQHRANVERAGLPFAPVADPPDDEWMPLLDAFGELDLDAADALMIGDFFAGIDTRAALPDLLGIVEDWRPDLIVRECWEFGSAIVAELHGIPLARVGLGPAALEARTLGLAAGTVDRIRVGAGLSADQNGDRLRDTPYLTLMPELLELPAPAIAPCVERFRPRPPGRAAPPPLPWPAGEGPFVYLSFGSVAAGAHLPFFPALYRDAIEALAPLPARVLVTIGRDPEPAQLGPLPPNVRVEAWVPQDAVLPHAAAMVCHGGFGSTLGALTHGVPLVVVPLFSGDQWTNAEAVDRVGAGIALDAERGTRRVLGLPGRDTIDALAPAVRRLLEDAACRDAAGRVAGAVRALPPVEHAVRSLEAFAARPAPPSSAASRRSSW